MSKIDLEKLKYKGTSVTNVNDTSSCGSSKYGKAFIKGPIMLHWIGRAAQMPRRTLHVALALLYLSGLTKSKTVKMQGAVREKLGISQEAYSSGLKRMESQGLIYVQRFPGQTPKVTILDQNV